MLFNEISSPITKKTSIPYQFLSRLPVDIIGQNKIHKFIKLNLLKSELKFFKILKSIENINREKNNKPIRPVSDKN